MRKYLLPVTLITLALAMTFACAVSLYGILFYLRDHSMTRGEGLMIMGYMTFYAAPLFPVYGVIVFFFRRRLTRKLFIGTALPFLAKVALIVWGTLLGTPW